MIHLSQQERVSSESQMLIMVQVINNMASIGWLHEIFQKTLPRQCSVRLGKHSELLPLPRLPLLLYAQGDLSTLLFVLCLLSWGLPQRRAHAS